MTSLALFPGHFHIFRTYNIVRGKIYNTCTHQEYTLAHTLLASDGCMSNVLAVDAITMSGTGDVCL